MTCAAGVLTTAAVVWLAVVLDRSSEHRLLQVQTAQAAAVVSATVTTIQAPLQTAAGIAAATSGDAQAFTGFMTAHTGVGALFTAASLWHVSTAGAVPVVAVGAEPTSVTTSKAAQSLAIRASASTTFVVAGLTRGGAQVVAYAFSRPDGPTASTQPLPAGAAASSSAGAYVVYAERVVPATRRVAAESNPAFADLNFATYLGPTQSPATLETTNVAADRLPLAGYRAVRSIPFGDSSITLVATPVGHLGSSFGAQLPWIFALGGVILSAVAGSLATFLSRQRLAAEQAAGTIADLYRELDSSYEQQRGIAQTLQRALLPTTNPDISELQFATRYVAGADGVDIGGDWYSAIRIDDTRFAFVVGDVSGRGVPAAAIMARVRFTLRAYLVEGHDPGEALHLCAGQLDIARDRHMATVLVGVGDLTTRRIQVANAGHLNPLLLQHGVARFIDTAVGRPLGVNAADSYATTTFTMDDGDTLLLYTDGLVERRTESLDIGLDRLAASVAGLECSAEELATHVLTAMLTDPGSDDVALLAFRWCSSATHTTVADLASAEGATAPQTLHGVAN